VSLLKWLQKDEMELLQTTQGANMRIIALLLSAVLMCLLLARSVDAGSLLNSDPSFLNPDEDKVLFNPHVFPTSYSDDWRITFANGKMTMWLNNTSSDFVHVAAGAFYDVDWNHGVNNKLSENYGIMARVKGNITQLQDGSWLRAGVAIAGKLAGTGTDFFTESDFFWGSGVRPPFGLGVALLHDHQYGPGETFDIALDLTSKLEANWKVNYEVWAVYVVIEARNAAMGLDVFEFDVWYELRDVTGFNLLSDIGFALILAGIVVSVVAVALFVISSMRSGKAKAKVKGGGAVIIGPIPIIFGTDKESVKIILVLSIILVVLLLILTIFASGVFR